MTHPGQESPTAFLSRAGIKWKKMRGKNGAVEARFPCPHCASDEGFNLNLGTGLWNCLRASCGQGGNLYQLKVALGLAYEVEPQTHDNTQTAKARLSRMFRKKEPGKEHERWQQWLSTHKLAANARSYLEERKLGRQVWKVAKLGWLPRHPGDKRTGKLVGAGMISIPYLHDGSAIMTKLRWVPPEPDGNRYMRTKGGESVLYAPLGLDTSKTALVVGGELDALSVVQAAIDAGLHEDGWKYLEVCPISVPGGEGNWDELWTEQLSECEDIVLCFDNDPAGKAGIEKAAKAIGQYRCRLGKWPGTHKDANVALKAGDLPWQAVEELVENAKSKNQDAVIHAGSLADSVVSFLFDGLPRGWPTGWEDLDELIGGWRGGEQTLLTGQSGGGKTTFAYQALLHQLAEGRRCLLCPFEGGPRFAGVRLARQLLEQDPAEASRERVHDAILSLGSRLLMLDHVGAVDPDAYRETLAYAIDRLGVAFTVVDHLHFMTKRGDKRRWDIQDQLIMDSQMVVQRSDSHLLMLAHSSAARGSQGNRDDYIVQLSDIKGHTEAFQDVANVLCMYRPRSHDRQDERNPDGTFQAAILSMKQRMEYGGEGMVELSLDKEAGRYRKPTSGFSTRRDEDLPL